MTSVLVVDDDPSLVRALERALRLEGHTVTTASSVPAAKEEITFSRPDALVLDIGLPGRSGLDLTRDLRREKDSLPILLLTARDAVSDRVAGLDAGADDYVVKPFALEELLARLRALLRRSAEEHEILSYADLTLDLASRQATRSGRTFDLTRTEFELLALFLRNPQRVLTRSILIDRVWGYDAEPMSNSLEVFIGYLRKKTEAAGEERLIHTSRSVGYVLR